VDGGRIELGDRGDAASIEEHEIVRECFDGSGHSIAAG
jgi:hypothetical protein